MHLCKQITIDIHVQQNKLEALMSKYEVIIALYAYSVLLSNSTSLCQCKSVINIYKHASVHCLWEQVALHKNVHISVTKILGGNFLKCTAIKDCTGRLCENVRQWPFYGSCITKFCFKFLRPSSLFIPMFFHAFFLMQHIFLEITHILLPVTHYIYDNMSYEKER